MLGAYQYLLDWHRDQYVNDDPEKWAKGKTPRLYRTYKEEWRLTTDERKRILLNNIYGLVFNTYFAKARSKLMRKYAIPQLVEIEDKIFQNAEVGDSLLFFAQIASRPEENSLIYFRVKNIFPQFEVIENFKNIQNDLLMNPDALFYQSKLLIKTPTVNLHEVLSV